MGSRCYIGRVVGDKVRYIYSHKGAYLDDDGYGHILLTHFNEAERVDSLISQGSICDIEDNGRVMSYHEQEGREIHICMVPLQQYKDFDAIDIETLYLWDDDKGWQVRSRMHFNKPFLNGFWFELKDVLSTHDRLLLIKEARDNLSEQARKALLLVAEFKDFLEVYEAATNPSQFQYEADNLLKRADLLLECKE